jgi:hypothetical protein
MHGGGKAGNTLAEACQAYDRLVASDLGAKEKPEYISFQEGDIVKIQIRGVVGFLDIILKIAITLDAEISKSQFAEREFLARCEKGFLTHQKLLKARSGRSDNLKKLIMQCNFPSPLVTDEIENYLASKSLII